MGLRLDVISATLKQIENIRLKSFPYREFIPLQSGEARNLKSYCAYFTLKYIFIFFKVLCIIRSKMISRYS